MGVIGNPGTPAAGPSVILITAGFAALLGVVLLLLPPTGTDLAAQQARASFAAHTPGAAVDLRWYAGVLPAAYSVVAPYLEAVAGVRLAGALAAAVSAVLLAVLLVRWGVRRPLPASLWGAVALAGNVVSGRVTFALGLALGLATLVAVPRAGTGSARRGRWVRWLPAVLLSVLTALTSPVAAVFLGLVCVVWALRRRALLLPAVGAGLPLLAVAVLFPEHGSMPFDWHVAWPVLLAALAVLALCPPPLVRVTAVVYGLATLVVFLAPGPVGSNVERLGVLFAGVVVVAWSATRPILLVPVLAVLAWWTVLVPVRDLRDAPAVTRERAASLRLVAILDGLGPVTGRVEVVPFLDHGEARTVADAWPLARGWERQVDVERSPLFYDGSFSADRYRAWLGGNAVEYVAVGRHRHDWSAGAELRLLADPPAWLEPVHRDAEWTVWRVAGARALADDPVVRVTPDRVVLDPPAAGVTRLAVRWSRWLTVSGGACLRRAGDRVEVVSPRAGRVTVASSYLAPFRHDRCH